MSAETATVGSAATTTFRAEGSTLRRGKLGRDLPALQGYGVATGFRTLPVGWQKTLLRAGPSGSPAHCRQQLLGRRKATSTLAKKPFVLLSLVVPPAPSTGKAHHCIYLFKAVHFLHCVFCFIGFCSCLYYFLLLPSLGLFCPLFASFFR